MPKLIHFGDLGEVEWELIALDRKLTVALGLVCTGEFNRTVTLKQTDYLARHKKQMSSVQVLRFIFNALRTTQ